MFSDRICKKMRPAWNDQSESFFDRPDVILVCVWAFFLIPTLGLIAWFLISDRRQKRKDAERREQGEEVPERTFFSSPEIGESNMGPGTKLFFHVVALIGVALVGYWLTEGTRKQFADLESGKVQSINVVSPIAWAYRTMGKGGAIGLMYGLVIVILCILWDDTVDTYRAFRKSRREKDKGDSRKP
ncbi:hypothetical protein [Roseimicrobium sp. ORNL1]|uniref:hypothetical protein n=1 Tax=Roseimicrobium sp. ORNL1 TaxID=2711231 RepID=UPI0013E1183C|nr:hypothetical protein [Roseimicrobium sp. ORNL1]QIF02087.1 hypothetical protein G5S37_11265 [Roseimicrobium sp. ORNL1]